ncbi:MAG: Xaa-Pro peptidase family protein [Micrococcales bacterium]|nr:Xaa-Pro peptidase family protein [Micrococcales bacterium]
MTSAAIDALLLTTEPEVRYFSGFFTRFWESPARPWFLVVPLSGKPVAVIPEIGEPLMAKTWIDDIRTWPSPRPTDEGVTLLSETLREVVGDRGRTGVPMGPETTLRMPLGDYTRLTLSLPGVTFADATMVIRDQRMVKSEAEVDKIAHVCRIASDSFATIPHVVTSGQRLTDVLRDVKIDLLARGVDDVPYLVGAAGPGGYDNVISAPDERPLSEGDVLMVDVGANYDGYFCDFDRNFTLGPATADVQRGNRALHRATDAAFAAAHPGATCAELFHAMATVIEDAGYAVGTIGRMGHGLGMQLTEWPSHTPTDHTPLTSGMVLTLEPSLSLGAGRGLVHEENIVIRDTGAQLLSRRAPQEMTQIG